MDLVKLEKAEIVCDSQMVARKFGFKHSEVTKTVRKLLTDIENLRGGATPPYFLAEDRVYRGIPFTAYLMSREFFSLLCMRFKGGKALEWQMKFNGAFYEMEKRLLQGEVNRGDEDWLTVRTQSKAMRLMTTDVIAEFVEYATAQGSKNAKFYYKHFTNATYKALALIQHNKPKLRDTLNFMELSQLVVAEQTAKQRIRYYMEQGEHYKVIFTLVKQDLVALGELTRLPS